MVICWSVVTGCFIGEVCDFSQSVTHETPLVWEVLTISQ